MVISLCINLLFLKSVNPVCTGCNVKLFDISLTNWIMSAWASLESLCEFSMRQGPKKSLIFLNKPDLSSLRVDKLFSNWNEKVNRYISILHMLIFIESSNFQSKLLITILNDDSFKSITPFCSYSNSIYIVRDVRTLYNEYKSA